jgi:ankyrin repeat protein
VLVVLSAQLFAQANSGQTPAKVDFRRDVQPIFRTNCYGCHGPTRQMNNFRLDRRRDAMRGGTLSVIGPGNSAGSKLYLRLIGKGFRQMPPTGALPSQQIDIIKAWIEQGAEWPDDASGETAPLPPDPKATQMMEALRSGHPQSLEKLLAEDPEAINRKGPGGSTPLMYAALYGSAGTVRLLLEKEADPKLRNDAGATALMWAVDDAEKTRLLLAAGADANVRSDDGQTALLIASGRFGSSPVVKLLLDRHADPSAKSPFILGDRTPVAEAAYAGDDAVLRLLIEHGADVKRAGYLPLYYAMKSNCIKCFDLLVKSADRDTLNPAAALLAPPLGDAGAIKLLLDHGADANTKDRGGNPLLLRAAASDTLPMDTIRALLDQGADLNAKGPEGKTALDVARQRGATPVVDLLLKAGATEGGTVPEPVLKPQPAGSVRGAIQRTLPLLQRADATFLHKSGCVSCHNDSLAAMAVVAAPKGGFGVDQQELREQVKTISAYLETWRERALQGIGIPGESDTVSYILLGLAAQNCPPDAATDAMAHYLKTTQTPEGRWGIVAHRPPMESNDIEVTAVSMRALQIYGPKARRPEYEKAAQSAAAWLAKAQAKTTEERAFQLLGMGWAGEDKETIRKVGRGLINEQRADGGWAQLPTLASDAYATGQALVALQESGALPVADATYRRGIRFLLNTQLEDGSWHVKSRAIPVQPYFESNFPHGHDQWISAAATSWAIMALTPAAEEPVKRAASEGDHK